MVSPEAAAPGRLRQGESVPLRFAGNIAQGEERVVPHRDGASAKNKSSVHSEGLLPSGRGATHSVL